MDIKFWKNLGSGRTLRTVFGGVKGQPSSQRPYPPKPHSPSRVQLDEGLNRLRKGGVNASPPVDAVPPPAPPPQKKRQSTF